VEPNVKVVNGRYEIPVPLKDDVAKNLPDNYVSALNRTSNVHRNALKNDRLRAMLTDTFHEIISEKWIVPVEDNAPEDVCCWYLPFFVAKQDKPRVVFEGAAIFRDFNDVVLPGANLHNGLIDVLTIFRMGKYACMADLNKCFFQVAMPAEQRD